MLVLKTFTQKDCFKNFDITSILDKLILNSLIYQDSEGKYVNDLGNAILNWDHQKFKTLAFNLLKKLKYENRFLKNPKLIYSLLDSNDYIFKIFSNCDIDALITNTPKCLNKNDAPFEFIELKEFVLSEFYKKIKNNEKIRIEKKLREKLNFKNIILKPIMENSQNTIEIYDRCIVDSGIRFDQFSKKMILSPNYEYTIRFVIKSFLDFTKKSKIRIFQLTSGRKKPLDLKNEVVNCFIELMSPFNDEPNFDYRIVIRDMGKGIKLHHDRFLFTNVFDYKFEEGFGFFHESDLTSDFKISHIDKVEAIQVQDEAKKLESLLTIVFQNKSLSISFQ